MNEEIERQLKFLGLKYLKANWDKVLTVARKSTPSYHRFLTEILNTEYHQRKERVRLSRIKRANIEEPYVIETFPFSKQPNLKKRLVLEMYDSQEYLTNPQELIFIGPTGSGKTGLATSFLIHALGQDYRGYFIDFKELVDELYQAVADHTEKKVIKRFQSYSCLVIDELGYIPIDKAQAGLFFDLMKKRHKKHTTLITTQMGFDEWGSFLQNKHLTAALIDRLTVHCTIFNLKKCVSIRPKKIIHATTSKPSESRSVKKQ